MAPDRMFAGLDLFPFLAMPFFILAGEIMNRSGITDRLVRLRHALVGWLRGGMAHSNMVASVMFAGHHRLGHRRCGGLRQHAGAGDEEAGLHRPFACAVTAAGSIIGPTIPPSTLMDHLRLAHGRLDRRAVRRRHPAGAADLPVCMAVIAPWARAQPAQGRGRASLLRVILKASARASWPSCCRSSSSAHPGGITTPTEAASIAVPMRCSSAAWSIAAELRDLSTCCVRTARITGVIFLIIASASILGWWMTFNQIPQAIAAGFLAISSEPR
jgi:TRAP-type transport system large permease protein